MVTKMEIPMTSSTLFIISLLILIIIFLVILIKYLKGSQSKQYDKSYSALNEISVEPAFDKKRYNCQISIV